MSNIVSKATFEMTKEQNERLADIRAHVFHPAPLTHGCIAYVEFREDGTSFLKIVAIDAASHFEIQEIIKRKPITPNDEDD